MMIRNGRKIGHGGLDLGAVDPSPSAPLDAALGDARAHLADDGALRWTEGTRDVYLQKSHELLVRIVAEASKE